MIFEGLAVDLELFEVKLIGEDVSELRQKLKGRKVVLWSALKED